MNRGNERADLGIGVSPFFDANNKTNHMFNGEIFADPMKSKTAILIIYKKTDHKSTNKLTYGQFCCILVL